ncbi:MAG: hypothetical protein ABIL58_13855 [Pseudomonadota bacterium]
MKKDTVSPRQRAKAQPRSKGRGAPSGAKKRRQAPLATGTRILTGEILDMRDYWGHRMPRYVAPAILRAAIHAHLGQPKNLLLESLSQLTGQPVSRQDFSEIKTVHFQEGQFQYIFRVAARLRTGGRVRLAMIVAKDGEKTSTMARRELQNLRRLHRRAPQFVVLPMAGGPIPLERGGPPVFVYFTRWLSDLHEMGVDSRHNFFINEVPVHTFSSGVSDILCGEILKILFAFYDPADGSAPEPPQVASGDFVVSRPQAGRALTLRLIACRHMMRSVSLESCLGSYLGYHGEWAGKIFHLVPKDPKLLFKALHEGLVIPNPGIITWDRLRDALTAYIADLKSQTGTQPAWTPLAVLKKLMGSLHLYLKEIDSSAIKGT